MEIRPWRDSPFKTGRTYRVRRDFASLRDVFRVNELLVFETDAWSRYDGMTGYFFKSQETNVTRVWDVADDAYLARWTDLFEPL
jgi:hypothetical protein